MAMKHRLPGSAWICASLAVAVGSLAAPASAQENPATPDPLGELSLEELTEVQVTSVSGSAQPVGEAPGAVFVLSSDDMVRAGVRSVIGALRLAPNLHIGRIDAANYGISARGFNHSSGTANKLLVLMDGRVVYTPLFSGVFWDEQNTIIEDLDRIEVVSGPGGTLWGSNAVNGVINIVSRDAHETTGWLAMGGASDASRAASVRYGARIGESGAFRVYGLGLQRAVDEPNEWTNVQGGFRADWSGGSDAATLQGDLYVGDQADQPAMVADTTIRGANLLGRWSRRYADDSNLSVQAYIDRTERQIASGVQADVTAAAIDARYTFSLGDTHDFVLGGGVRVTRDTFESGSSPILLDPDERTLQTYGAFAQDTIALSPTLDLIAGLKLEHNSYTGLEYLPSARLAWRASPTSLLWMAVSRAVRTPSRFDTDLINPGVINGGPDFVSEQLTAYELGYRAQPSERFWYSASAYYNFYEDLRTLEGPFPLEIQNGMRGHTYGLEAWGSYALTDWWRLNGGFAVLRKELELEPGSTDVFGIAFAGNDPEFQANLRSLIDINARTQFDVAIRHVGELPSPQVDAYTAVDARIGFRVTDHLELSVTGYNLVGDDHIEFINPSLPPRENPQSFFFSARWRS